MKRHDNYNFTTTRGGNEEETNVITNIIKINDIDHYVKVQEEVKGDGDSEED